MIVRCGAGRELMGRAWAGTRVRAVLHGGCQSCASSGFANSATDAATVSGRQAQRGRSCDFVPPLGTGAEQKSN